MKYIKLFEGFEDGDYSALKKSISDLSGAFSRFSRDLQNNRRRITPTEIYEDYFLDLMENERYYVRIDKPSGSDLYSLIGPIWVYIHKIVGVDEANEDLFRNLLSKLTSIKNRLEGDGHQCHFTIEFGGRHQCDLNPKSNKNDDYKYKGFGDKISGRDSSGKHYNSVGDGYVPVECKFIII